MEPHGYVEAVEIEFMGGPFDGQRARACRGCFSKDGAVLHVPIVEPDRRSWLARIMAPTQPRRCAIYRFTAGGAKPRFLYEGQGHARPTRRVAG